GVGAGDGEACDGDGLGVGGGLVGEAAAGAAGAEGDGVACDDAAQHPTAGVECRCGQPVVDLVRGGDAGDRQRGGGDVGRRGRLGDGVVVAVGAAGGEAGDGDGLAVADELVGEAAAGAAGADRDRVTRDDPDEGGGAGVEGCGGEPVVDLVGGGD